MYMCTNGASFYTTEAELLLNHIWVNSSASAAVILVYYSFKRRRGGSNAGGRASGWSLDVLCLLIVS